MLSRNGKYLFKSIKTEWHITLSILMPCNLNFVMPYILCSGTFQDVATPYSVLHMLIFIFYFNVPPTLALYVPRSIVNISSSVKTILLLSVQ